MTCNLKRVFVFVCACKSLRLSLSIDMDLLTLQQTGNLSFSLARLIERKAGRIYLLELFDASNTVGRREV